MKGAERTEILHEFLDELEAFIKRPRREDPAADSAFAAKLDLMSSVYMDMVVDLEVVRANYFRPELLARMFAEVNVSDAE